LLEVRFSFRRWAAEGLSFLTLDAEVKERLIEDEPAMKETRLFSFFINQEYKKN
jgi:hypothetical protein